MVQIQNNFTEMFLMMPSINIDDNMATRAKNKKKSLNDISIATSQYIISSCIRIQMSDSGP